MAGLSWTALVLAFFLSPGNTLADVDQNWLTSIIEGIKNEYALGDTFSLAVNVPQNQDPDSLQQIFQDDPANKVKQTVSRGQVYQGIRVVAAAHSGALSRVLENTQPLIKSSEGNFLIIYSKESPCGPTCTTDANNDSIPGKISNVIQNWNGYAFVFSKVIDIPGTGSSQLAESFKQLGISKLGLDNIFRCYGDHNFQCTSCSSGGEVTPLCVANPALTNQEQGADDDVSVVPQTDTGDPIGLSNEIGDSIGDLITTGMGEGTRGHRGQGKGRQMSMCKRRGSGCKRAGGRRGEDGGVRRRCRRRGGCKRRGGGRRGKGGRVRRRCRRRGGCKRRGGGRRGKGGRVKRRCRRRGGCKRRGGGRRGKGGRVRRRRNRRRGGKSKRWGKGRRWRRGKGRKRSMRMRRRGKRWLFY